MKFSGTPEEWEEDKTKVLDKLDYPQDAIVDTVKDYDKLNDAKAEHSGRKLKLWDEFRKDLFEELGVADNPKAERCYEIAVEYASADCEQRDMDTSPASVYVHFCDLVQLIY